MYLYPTFLDCINYSKIHTIVSEHMNEAAKEAINYLKYVSSDLTKENSSEQQKKEAREYLNLFFPERLKGQNKMKVLDRILERLESPVLGDLTDEEAYILYHALPNLYDGKEKYSLEKKEDEDLNIFRIENEEDRNFVIESLKENIEDIKSFYSGEIFKGKTDEDLIFCLMDLIENVNNYGEFIIDLVGDEDFLDFSPITR